MGQASAGKAGANGAAQQPGTRGSETEPLPRSIVWIASYPGSGAGLLHALLLHYLVDDPLPLDPAMIRELGVLDSNVEAYRRFFDGPLTEMTPWDQVYNRQRVIARLARQGPQMALVPTQNANRVIEGLALAPPGMTRLALYVARNPLDVAVSMARGLGLTQEAAVAAMTDPTTILPGNAALMPRAIGDWTGHVRGWAGERRYPVISLRFEEILASPEAALTGVLQALQIDVDAALVAHAVAAADLDRLVAEEAPDGPAGERFGDIGTVGQWQDHLDPGPARHLRDTLEPLMRRLGYL